MLLNLNKLQALYVLPLDNEKGNLLIGPLESKPNHWDTSYKKKKMTMKELRRCLV